MASEEVVYPLASEVPYPKRISRPKWNGGCGLFRDVGESCEEWKSRLESRWDSIINEMQATRMVTLKETNTIDVRSIISRDDFPPSLLNTAASNHSFQVVEFLLSTGIYSGSQVEECLDTALSSAWYTLEKVTSVVCSKMSQEMAINCFKLIATLCLPQMKAALSTLDCFACFMSDELLAKEACNRAKQGRFLDYALLLMVAPGRVLNFTGMPNFLDGLRSEMSSSEWPVVFRTCIFLTDIFSNVYGDFYELWQSSERLTQNGIVHRVYSTCRRAGLPVCYNDIKLGDAHTLCPQPKLSDVDIFPRILRPDDLPKNIYPTSFAYKLLSTVNVS